MMSATVVFTPLSFRPNPPSFSLPILAGPFTVFVPSNEALQKVPDSDLEIIRNNMTALKG